MGEIADSMIDGEVCQACMTPLAFTTGFPSFCSEECAEQMGQPDGYVPTKL